MSIPADPRAFLYRELDPDTAARLTADALARAQKSDRPTLIACKTIIAYGAPTKAGSEKSHGSPLGPEEIAGARKKLNMLKPWSPSWSYGLVVRCDATMRAVASLHSRADGSIHGVTSLAESGGALFVGARGSGALVRLQEQGVPQ